MSAQTHKRTRTGGCHCGAVRYEVELPDQVVALSCNCSICAKTGFIHVFVEDADFKLVSGADSLTEYTFGTHTAKHWFCKTCGVKAHYKPRSHPHGISVNLRCLDEDSDLQLRFQEFDGANWDENIHKLHPDAANQA
ncbi:GFA family protein [Maricaulis sp. CAU 1757]